MRAGGRAVGRTGGQLLAALLVLSACPPIRPSALWAQCPDGSPPPCARAGAPVRAAAAPDPHRIAILPFRVTGADTTLGEGIAELLSAEFTGESGPRAVHMGTVIRGWRQAGGGAREPLTQPVAMRAARQMGAGLFIDGSIVGLGNRLTVTASVVSAIDGQSRRAESIRGSADSLDVLMSRLTSTLLALAGGESREGSRGVLTASTSAMRAYIEGMSEWRRYRREEANAAFERAFREDSTFARAALMRYWTANFIGEPIAGQWGRAVFALRERLSSADRLLVTALLGEHYPAVRFPAVSFADRQRAAAQLPESPEAQYLAGDWLFHYSGAIDATDAMERARGYFIRSIALDSQQTVLGHLVDVAVMLADTALLRSLQPALEARAADMYNANWAAAGYLGDRAWLSRLRGVTGNPGVLMFETMGLLPASLSDELTGRATRGPAGPPPGLPGLVQTMAATTQGRPNAALRFREAIPTGQFGIVADFVLMYGAMAGDQDSASGAAAAQRLQAASIPDSMQAAQRDCAVTLWHAWQGDDAGTPLALRDETLSCTTMVELLRAWRAGSPDLASRLESADSLVRRRMNPSRYQGYENLVLARVWEAQGNRRRALSAIRLYPVGAFISAGIGRRLRDEGRLAAALGDVDRAIQAYRLYLDYRKDAEPSMQAERDSVRAAMARLVRP